MDELVTLVGERTTNLGDQTEPEESLIWAARLGLPSANHLQVLAFSAGAEKGLVASANRVGTTEGITFSLTMRGWDRLAELRRKPEARTEAQRAEDVNGNRQAEVRFKLLVVPGYTDDAARLVRCVEEALPVSRVVEEDLHRARFWFEREITHAPEQSIVVFVDPFEGERAAAGDYYEWIQEVRTMGRSLAQKPVFVLFTTDASLSQSGGLSHRQVEDLRRYFHVSRGLKSEELLVAVRTLGQRIQAEWERFPSSGHLEARPSATGGQGSLTQHGRLLDADAVSGHVSPTNTLAAGASMPATSPPKAFISYSWDSDAHKAWVRSFATRLRADGVDVVLDQWNLGLGDQLPQFMESSVRGVGFVILVCTPKFKAKADGRTGGVGYEGHIITAEAFGGASPRKFVPVLREGEWKTSAPTWLAGKLSADLRSDPYSESEYARLLEHIHEDQAPPPPLGSYTRKNVKAP